MNADKQQDYLWDPGAEPDADVAAIERQLAELRYDAASRPLTVPNAVRPRAWRRTLVPLAVAATLLVAAGGAHWQWRLTWPEGRAWTLRSQSFDGPLEVGRGLTIPAGEHAVANIARIGTMRLDGGSAFELRQTRGTRHRLRMTGGSMHVRVWAPPSSVVVETPAGEVIDMGCEFVLTVTGSTTAVRVLSGWVQIENGIDEVRIPAGASTEMTATDAPGVAVFDDAAAGFREAVRRVERTQEAEAVGEMLRLARTRDVFTLLILADHHPAVAAPIFERASALSPPPADVTIDRILRGDRYALWDWQNSLPLPPLKSGWWRNWRDALPLR